MWTPCSNVACFCSRSSRDEGLTQLIRCLVFWWKPATIVTFTLMHIPTKANHLADDLSRDNESSFLFKVPSANPHPSPVSQPLLDLLQDPMADWTFQSWRHLFTSTLSRV